MRYVGPSDLSGRLERVRVPDPRRDRERGEPADGIEGVRVCDVQARPLTWVWPGRLAAGKITVLAGDPGLGKSFVTLDLAARLSRGWAWPDEPDGAQNAPRRVVLISAEDGLEDTICPRLKAAGADAAQVIAVRSVCRLGAGGEAFGLAEDVHRLAALLEAVGEVGLVVIDPVTAFVGSRVDDHRNNQVRAVLAPLGQALERAGAAGLLVTHLNKGNAGGKALYRAMGSLAYVAAARTGFLVVRDPDDPDRRLLLSLKNNLAEEPPGLAFAVRDGRVAWDARPVERSADEVLQAEALPRAAPPGSKVGDCARWLAGFVTAAGVPARAVFDEARARGFSEATVKRARAQLPIRVGRDGYGSGGQSLWSLRPPDPDGPLPGFD